MNAWWLIRLSIELALFMFHVSVAVVIVVQVKRRHSSFATGFFFIYLLQGVNDWMNYLAV